MASKKTEKTVTLTEENFLALLNGLKKAADILQSATGNILIGADLPIEEEEPAKPAAKSKAKKAPEPEPEEDDEDEESDDLTREDLEGMSLAVLRKTAAEYDIDKSDLKGLDKDGIIDLILGEGDVEDEDDEEDDEDEEDGEEPYTKEELADMSLADLKAIAKEWDVKIKPGTKQAGYIKAILAAQDED